MSEELKSPFKFLDPYTPEDRDIFFGRDEEINTLYDLVFHTKLILVYGPSGSGKTSLVQCGLASCFKRTDWFKLQIRRRNEINQSLWKELRANAATPIEDGAGIVEAVDSIFLDYFKPIYLIFDQFEELYILGSKIEREQFIKQISALIKAEINCKVIFIIREEYLGQLYDFEKKVPILFDHRLRVEPMTFANVSKVIEGSAEKFNIKLENPKQTILEIIENISDGRSGVQLSYLQIYLDRLYRESRIEDRKQNLN